MTNEKLPTDDGTNVKKLIQSNNYDGLFDNNESDNGFEFKWDIAGNQQDGKLPEYVMLPTTMRFELNEPRALRDVQIVNRDTYNGTVTSMKAVITYTDGTKSESRTASSPRSRPSIPSLPRRARRSRVSRSRRSPPRAPLLATRAMPRRIAC